MGSKLQYIIVFLALPFLAYQQVKNGQFDFTYWNRIADEKKLSSSERTEFISSHQRAFIHDLKQITFPPLEAASPGATQKGYGVATTFAGPCTNIDFESGTLAGWTRTCGFHPLYNVVGCCPNPNGVQTIVTGTGLDPYGLFPVVYPGGTYSLKLGNNLVNGQADRISQTFFVTAANANFTYRYAVVLEDPGHTLAQQPAFVIEMVDSVGNQIPCTTYSVAAGNNIPGFAVSSISPNVVYKPWTSVAMDLTPVIGQNVTIRFTTYDCALGGHFGYAYVDGLCTNFATSTADTTCLGTGKQMCGPAGFATYNWNGPGVVNNPSICITPTAAGVYTCQTILVPGCPGPTFTHTLTTLVKPVLTFTATAANNCAFQYSFTSSSSIASGSISSYQWFFGDNTSTFLQSPTHTYPGPGTYNVKFKATSNLGCQDSVMQTVTIYQFPNLSFSPPSNCVNTVVQFTNSSTVPGGSVASYTWTLGNGATSNLQNPTNTYTANGTYTIQLSATSNQGCVSSLTQTLGIFPPPVISFSANPLCDVNGTSFSPSTSTAVASGSLVAFSWNFGDGGTSTASNPNHIYNASGTYTVSFTATTDHFCVRTVTNALIISPTPTVAFNTFSLNNCAQNFSFTNTSSGATSYSWNFGTAGTSTLTNPSFSFPGPGNYTITLIATSPMGCADTAFKPVTIYPAPSVSMSVPASCENAIFTASTLPLSGTISTYQWNFGDPASGGQNTSGLQNPTHRYSTQGNYTVNLQITSSAGCPASYSTAIVVHPNPIAVFSISAIDACSTQKVFTNMSGVVPAATNSITNYQWSFVTGTTSVASPTNTFAGPGSYTATLIAYTNFNCSDTVSQAFLIHPYPQLSFTVNNSCLNVPAMIAASSSISGVPDPLASIATYTWNYGDNSASNIASPPPHTYPAAGDYTVTYSATSNQGCVSSVTRSVTIYPVAAINFSITGNMCFGNTTQFTSAVTVPPPSSVAAYAWTFGDGSTSTLPSPTHNYSTSASFPVNFSVTTSFGCVSALTKTATVFPLPVVAVSASNVCLGNPTPYNATVSVASGFIVSYGWLFGDGTLSTSQNVGHTYTTSPSPAPFTATFAAGTNAGCSSSTTVQSYVHPLPNISFSPPGACVNTTIQFTNTSNISAGSIASYSWNFGNGNGSSLVNPTQAYSAANLYTVTVTATSDQGCARTSTNTLSIYPYPQATVSTVNNTCINDVVTFTPNVSITAGSISSYSWNFGDGTTIAPSPSVGLTPHTFTAYNTYTVSLYLVSNQNCAITTNTTVAIFPKPIPSFVASKFCDRDGVSFINTSTIPSPTVYSIASHAWNFNDGATSTSTISSPNYTFSGPGTYTVNLTETSNPQPGLLCSASISSVIVIHALPTVSFNVTNACVGAANIFSNASPTVGITAWAWDFDADGNTNSAFGGTNSFQYAAPGTYTAILSARNSFSCSNSFTAYPVVFTNPVADFSVSTVCQGDSTRFLNKSVAGDGSIVSYNYALPGGASLSTPNAAYLLNAAGSYTAKLTVTSQYGCSSSIIRGFAVNEVPTLAVTAKETCLGKSTQFTNGSYLQTGSITAFYYDYENTGSEDSNAVTVPPYQYPSAGSHALRVRARSDKGCSTTATVLAMVHDLPVSDFVKTGRACTDDLVKFTDLSTTRDGEITAASWDFNGDKVPDTFKDGPAFNYTVNGNYTVSLLVTTKYGCQSTSAKTIHVNAKAKPIFNSDRSNGCPPLCVNFNNSSYLADGQFTSRWDFGDLSPTVDQKDASHCFTTGNYAVSLVLTTDSGCVSELRNPSAITVYTTPVAGFKIEPEEIDENEPTITVSSTASDNNSVRYFISDGTVFNSAEFTHNLKNLNGKTKPLIVQIVKNGYGCADTVYNLVQIKPAFTIFVPNVFTPNADGKNDVFQAKGVGIVKFDMQIYDRWGSQVYETHDIELPWDGRYRGSDGPIKQDVYIWKAQVLDLFGKTHHLTGKVTLLQ